MSSWHPPLSAPKESRWYERWCSASELDTAAKCPASSVLPKYETVPTDSTKRAVIWGKGIHKWVETGDLDEAGREVYDRGEPATSWLRKALEVKLQESRVQRGKYWPDQVKREVCYTVNLDSDEVIQVKDKFSFPKLPGSLRLIVDLEREGAVEELKTGFHVPPLDTLQIKAACLATKKHVGILTHWPRYPKEGLPDRKDQGGVITHENLKAVKEELTSVRESAKQALAKLNAGKMPDVNPGEHCNFCKRKPGCPAHVF